VTSPSLCGQAEGGGRTARQDMEQMGHRDCLPSIAALLPAWGGLGRQTFVPLPAAPPALHCLPTHPHLLFSASYTHTLPSACPPLPHLPPPHTHLPSASPTPSACAPRVALALSGLTITEHAHTAAYRLAPTSPIFYDAPADALTVFHTSSRNVAHQRRHLSMAGMAASAAYRRRHHRGSSRAILRARSMYNGIDGDIAASSRNSSGCRASIGGGGIIVKIRMTRGHHRAYRAKAGRTIIAAYQHRRQ